MITVSFDSIIAEAYRRASLAGQDMYAFVNQMERLQAAVDAPADLYKQWDQLDDLIGSMLTVGEDPAQMQLVRTVLIEQLPNIYASVVLEPGAKIADDWARWEQTYSEASFHWRLDAMKALCTATVFEERLGKRLHLYQQFIPYFKDRRWVETRAVFETLAENEDLPDEHRGYHYYVCGQIDLYFHYRYEQAHGLFEQAKTLLSGKPLSLHGLIEYYLKGPDKEKDLDKALALAEQALEIDPEDVPTIIQKGDILSEQGHLEEAESLYKLAGQKRPGNTLCYTRLIDLYGKAELFSEKERELESLLEIDAQLDPDTSFLSLTDLGVVYQNHGEEFWSKSEQFHLAAIDQYPEGIMAALNLGYLYLDITKEPGKARPIFQNVIDRVPDAREGFLAMARLQEVEQDWEGALANYQKVRELIPSWDRFMQATIGRCQRQLGRLEAAQESLLAAWKQDKYGDSGALTELYDLAEKWYKAPEDPQPEKAIALLGQAAESNQSGPATASGISNRQGHVYYYVERYTEALPYYQQAAGLDGTEPVYFTNQFDCYEKLYKQTADEAHFSAAMAVLSQAAELDPQDSSIPKKRRQLALIHFNPHLAELPTLHQVHIEVGQPLLGQVTQDYQSLLPEISTLTDALRERMHDRYGINLPGLRYRDIADGNGAYQFRVYETPVVFDQLPLEEGQVPQMADVLNRLEQFITANCLDLFINYWDVDKEVPLLPNDELVHFTRVVMALLAEQVPLPLLPELHQHYRRLDGPRKPVVDTMEALRLLEEIIPEVPGTQAAYSYMFLSEQDEKLLGDCLVGNGDTRTLAIPVDYLQRFVMAFIKRTEEHSDQQFAVVTRNPDLRACLRSVLMAVSYIPVLKASELQSDSASRSLEPLVVDQKPDPSIVKAIEVLKSMQPLNTNRAES